MRLGTTETGDLTLLLNAIQVTSKFIATNVRKARLINLYVSAATPMICPDRAQEWVLQERQMCREKSRRSSMCWQMTS